MKRLKKSKEEQTKFLVNKLIELNDYDDDPVKVFRVYWQYDQSPDTVTLQIGTSKNRLEWKRRINE
jgi:hypothetical protein